MTLTRPVRQIVIDSENSGNAGLLGRHASWERVALGDIADILNGAAFPSRDFNVNGNGLPLIRIRDVGVGNPKTYYSGPYDAGYLVTAGDILVGMDGDFRVARWQGPEGLLNQRVCKISVKDEKCYSHKFLELALQGYLDAIWAETSSVTVKHLSSRSICEIPLPLPPVREQERIVKALEDHLSRLDSGALSISRSRMRCKLIRESLLDELMDFNSERTVPIGDVVVESRGGWSRSRHHLVSAGGGVPYLKMNNISSEGELQIDDVVHVASDDQERAKYELCVGDVLFNNKNSAELVGKTAVADERVAGWLFNENITRLRLVPNVDPRFFVLQLNSPRFRRLFESLQSASTNVAAIYTRDLKRCPLWVPDLPTQQSIVARYDRVISMVRHAELGVRHAAVIAESLRTSLLGVAFDGLLVCQDSREESASTLLNRIQAECASGAKPNRARRVKNTNQEALL